MAGYLAVSAFQFFSFPKPPRPFFLFLFLHPALFPRGDTAHDDVVLSCGETRLGENEEGGIMGAQHKLEMRAC